jgi:NAD(P)-dependent dehydrogenase (short-subunit alcohol dehydrogenase family)
VAIRYYQNEAAAKDTLAKIHACGSDGVVIQADVSRPDDVIRMFNRIQADFGGLDIFVSNARPELAAFYQAPMQITLQERIAC